MVSKSILLKEYSQSISRNNISLNKIIRKIYSYVVVVFQYGFQKEIILLLLSCY